MRAAGRDRLAGGVALFGWTQRHCAGGVPKTHAPTVRDAIDSATIYPRKAAADGASTSLPSPRKFAGSDGAAGQRS
ncbi:hypothetical protein HMPREF0591_6363 [Mycobacterium parascrofulaceum ATCC BAA-614]|uniref:Uncharacterized protein n=1 Tax=Mycobacterium parascrofulaceum ATCC BAA-614 TaxID=525368 RepID=D5PJL9_9MYCO|nr:hypothetical protein HMPREF0591_6363 [Mycobacterium parascrofulaceum ATCC BAA-614]